MIRVEVVYAEPARQWRRVVEIPEGASVTAAIHASRLLEENPGIDLPRHKLGVFGKVAAAEHVLCDGDRVEIYRPLQAEPKDARRLRENARRAR